jgi:hypothetical protein
MGEVDRQRISAVRTLERLGYVYNDGQGWKPPQRSDLSPEADALHALLVERAGHLTKRYVGLREAAELRMIVKALEAYEAKRWPGGRKIGPNERRT